MLILVLKRLRAVYMTKGGRDATPPSQNDDCQDYQSLGFTAFKDFSQPSIVSFGHYMPLRCGHNGSFLSIERKVFENHLHAAGLLQGSSINESGYIS